MEKLRGLVLKAPVITSATGNAAVIAAAFDAYSGASATVVATAMNARQVAVVVANAAKIAAGGITGAISLSNAQFGALASALHASATLTVTDTSLNAAALIAMDTKAAPTVIATAVGEIVGTAANIAKAAVSKGIALATDYAATVDTGSAAAADLNTIDSDTSVSVAATAVTESTCTAAEIITAAPPKSKDR